MQDTVINIARSWSIMFLETNVMHVARSFSIDQDCLRMFMLPLVAKTHTLIALCQNQKKLWNRWKLQREKPRVICEHKDGVRQKLSSQWSRFVVPLSPSVAQRELPEWRKDGRPAFRSLVEHMKDLMGFVNILPNHLMIRLRFCRSSSNPMEAEFKAMPEFSSISALLLRLRCFISNASCLSISLVGIEGQEICNIP